MAIFNSYVSLPEGNKLTSIIDFGGFTIKHEDDIFECGWILFPQRYSKLGMKWDKHGWFVEIDALLFIYGGDCPLPRWIKAWQNQ